jgi:uncharacterized protein YqgC (DUF456 family)
VEIQIAGTLIQCHKAGMPEWFQSDTLWDGAGTGAAWLVTLGLLIVGIVGCFLPVLPGHLILFMAAVAHRLMLGKDGSGLEWWSFLILGVLMAASQTLELLSGAAGAKWFGGSRWGALGALAGGLIGMFFMPIGLLLGPLAGAVAGELAFARSHPRPALVSGVGSVVGTLAGMAIKLVIGALMILWFFLDVFWVG